MFKPILHTFPVGGRQFVFRKPALDDKTQSISRKQEICLRNNIVPNLMDGEENNYIFELGRLEIGLEQAPEEYYEERTIDGVIKKVVSLTGKNAKQIDPEEIEEVREEVNSFLLKFYRERQARKQLPGNIQPG